MAILVDNLLDVHSVTAVLNSLSDDLFVDGKKTAGKTARAVKKNLQADPKSPKIIAATKLVEQALRKHPMVTNSAFPDKLSNIIISRYDEGMTYGSHVDNAFIHATRTDLSFTLFLSDPDTYDGGELILQKHDGDDVIKLPQGSVYIYPTRELHYVAPVTRGVRYAAVGWIQSQIRSEEHRGTLFDLYLALQQMADTEENKQARLQILKARSNLMRMWAE
ncbi:Fe2+-dependent dioxygenase [Thalassolituus sp.]|uniref:Fe2+-dependent dioxygenase n=1 Tax=Thalassolituus sp. TaxID=2030822 RepID=UPI003515B275